MIRYNVNYSFKFARTKYTVSVDTVHLDGYENSYQDTDNRKGIVAIARRGVTGVPFSGIAILSPDDARTYSYDTKNGVKAAESAEKLAVRRALMALALHIVSESFDGFGNAGARSLVSFMFTPDMVKLIADSLYHEFRLAVMRDEDYPKYKRVMDIQREISKRKEQKKLKAPEKNKIEEQDFTEIPF